MKNQANFLKNKKVFEEEEEKEKPMAMK